MTSLLQNLPYREYQKALNFTLEQCEVIAKLANIDIHLREAAKPGELLIKTLDRRGFTAQQYKQYAATALSVKMVRAYYKPQTKVAILIANDKYVHLSKLATPSIDCDSLASNLNNLGFVVVTVKNSTSAELKVILNKVLQAIPEDSYCFMFYAGHGCELCNVKCMLSVECPATDIRLRHCVTENYVLSEADSCRLALCVLIMDMCRIYLDRATNPQIYADISSIEEYKIFSNLLIGYSAQSTQAAYEVLQIECSTTIDNEFTYELKTGDTDKIVPGASQYVNALCTRLSEDLDVSSMLDKVHADVENSLKKQRPIKVQCGVAKKSLYDPAVGDKLALLSKLKEIISTGFESNCAVF